MVVNILGIVISFVYFFGLLVISQHLNFLSLEGKRKFVHIMLGNWWILVLLFFDNMVSASIVPFSFVFINYFSLRNNKKGGLLSELERKGSKKSYGIILYPIAMLILVIISFKVYKDLRIGGLGLLALSYGDGAAALFGKKYDYHPFYVFGNKKTISGCVAMFLITFIVLNVYIIFSGLETVFAYSIIISAILALCATVFETITPLGIDNITIPLSVVALYGFIRELF